MAAIKLTDVMRSYDGTGNVVEWLDKFELLVKLRDIKQAETVLPMFLEGPALSVYTELGEQKKDVEAIKAALLNAFSLNPFRAYEQFAKRVWRDEPVDVFMTELRKLARLAGITSDKILLRAFVVGLPSIVSREMRATSGVEDMALSAVVERARALMSELMERPYAAVAVREARQTAEAAAVKEQARDGESSEKSYIERGDTGARTQDRRRCYNCGGPHLIRSCPRRELRGLKCWTCGGIGHMSRVCPNGQGNLNGGAGAPAAPQAAE